MQYRMIGIDLDGTLLDAHGNVSSANREAIERAIDAGVIVVPCTGRGWSESRMVLEQLPALQYGVFVSGATITDAATGRSLDMANMEPNLVHDLVQHAFDLPEAVLVYRDANQCGYDYLVTGRGELSTNTLEWWEKTGVKVHYQQEVTVQDLHHTLRVGVVGTRDRIMQIGPMMQECGGDRVKLTLINAVPMPNPGKSIFILELFAPEVDKWRSLLWIAAEHGVDRERIAAIGDQVNDVAMLKNAGCAVAMGNAIDAVKQEADHVTLHHDQDGVAHALSRMLDGAW